MFPCEVKQELAEEGDELTAGENPEEEAGEGDEEEALDEEEEEAEDDDQPLVQAQDLEPAYFVGFSEELGKAYRWDPKRRPQKKEYAAKYLWKEGVSAADPATAAWAGGWVHFIAARSCGEIWPEKFKDDADESALRNLPPSGKKKKKNANKDPPLFSGSSSDGTHTEVIWRRSRGWQLSLFIGTGQGRKQKCQMKPHQFKSNDAEGIVVDMCVKVMTDLANKVVNGECAETELFPQRDELARKIGLVEVSSNKRKEVEPAASAAAESSEPVKSKKRLSAKTPETLVPDAETAAKTATPPTAAPTTAAPAAAAPAAAPTVEPVTAPEAAAAAAAAPTAAPTVAKVSPPAAAADVANAPAVAAATTTAAAAPIVTMASLGIRFPQLESSSDDDAEEFLGPLTAAAGPNN